MCLRACQLVLELFGERAAGTEEQRLERGRRYAEDLGDLGVRATLELPQDDGLTLLRGNLRECGEELADARAFVVRLRSGDAVVEFDLARSSLLLPEPLLDRVARDGEEPVRGLSWTDALLEGAIGVEKCRLRDVFRVGVVAEHRVGVPVDLTTVSSIELVDFARGKVARFGYGHC